MIFMKRIIKKTLLLLEKTVLNVYENIFISPLFGQKRNVQHVWKPSNYSRISSIFWHLVQKPMEKRGIYLPLTFNRIHDKQIFKTFHNEHTVLDEFIHKNYDDIDKVFVDIGASDGVDMSNTFNLVLQNYKGYSFEVDDSKFAKMATIYRDFPNISLFKTKITPDNVSRHLASLDLPEVIKILNLDIDSYDYFVLEELLKDFKFQFLILEINPLFPMSVDFAVEFNENFQWEGNMFQGASISMFYKLLCKNEYSLIWIDRSFVLAINNDYLKDNINTIGGTEIDEILNNTLKENDNYRWQRFKNYRLGTPEDIIIKAKEEFKSYSNFYLKKSGF